jgi:uncharacterized membrane-anchored protein
LLSPFCPRRFRLKPSRTSFRPIPNGWTSRLARFGTLELHRGPQALPNGIVSLNLPPDYYALLGADAQWVMQDPWGNLPNPDFAALIFQTGTWPLDGSWGASVYWVDEGHISDIEADTVDVDATLNSDKDNDVEFNRQRTAQGMATMTTLGLSGVQGYDKLSHALRFSLLLRQEGYDQDVLNANVWVLARHGYVNLNVIGSAPQAAEVDLELPKLISMVQYTAGNEYAAYIPFVDAIGVIVKSGV